MRIYISLPITGQDPLMCVAEADSAEAVLRRKGHDPVNPLKLDAPENADYETLMGNDLTALLKCDGVVFLPGWRHSQGCLLEREAADIYGKQMWYGLNAVPWSNELVNIDPPGEEDDSPNPLMSL